MSAHVGKKSNMQPHVYFETRQVHNTGPKDTQHDTAKARSPLLQRNVHRSNVPNSCFAARPKHSLVAMGRLRGLPVSQAQYKAPREGANLLGWSDVEKVSLASHSHHSAVHSGRGCAYGAPSNLAGKLDVGAQLAQGRKVQTTREPIKHSV